MNNNTKDMVKVEGSVCEYPFFNFAKSEGKIEKKEYIFNPITLKDGRIEERTLTLETFKKWGLPTAFDMDVLIVISQIGTETNTLTGNIHFTLYEIAKRLGIPNKETQIKKSILRMYYVNCHSQYCVLLMDKKDKKKRYLTNQEYFHIFDRVGLLDVKMEKNNRKSIEETYVGFNKYFVQNFFSGYFQYIDFSKYLDLGNPTAKRLYIYLSKKKAGRSNFKISIIKLANIIPIGAKRTTEVRRLLKRACEHLKNKEIISNYKLEKGAMDITFYFPEERLKDSKKEESETLKLSDEKQKIYEQLIEIGVTDGVVKQLIQDHSTEKIERQLKWLKLRKGITDLPAVLVSSIRDNWAPPKEVVKKKESEKNQKQVESVLKRANEATFIVFSSGKKCEILRASDKAIEFIEDNERRMITINQALNCKFED